MKNITGRAGQRFFSRAGSGRVKSKILRVGSGRVREVSKWSRVGSGRVKNPYLVTGHGSRVDPGRRLTRSIPNPERMKKVMHVGNISAGSNTDSL